MVGNYRVSSNPGDPAGGDPYPTLDELIALIADLTARVEALENP